MEIGRELIKCNHSCWDSQQPTSFAGFVSGVKDLQIETFWNVIGVTPAAAIVLCNLLLPVNQEVGGNSVHM